MSSTTASETRLKAFVVAVLEKVGTGTENAQRAAEVIVEADLRGVDSHGVNSLGNRVKDLQAGRIVASAVPSEIGAHGALALFDGHHGYGPILCSGVLPAAIVRAEEYGMGMVLLRNSSHWGCPAYYSRWMAERGVIGIAISNTNPAMPLWGSSAKSIGNNPITIAAPRRGSDPVVLDMSMQQISWGSLGLAKQEGRRLLRNWGYDEEGNETDDAAVIIRSGRVKPMGEHKGSGLAFMLEILTGVMSAGAVCYEVGAKTAAGEPAYYSQSFIAIKPDLFAGSEGYFDKLETLYETAKKAPLAEGFNQIALPGDRSNETMATRRRDGIPLGRIRATVEALSSQFDLPLPWD